MENTRPQKNSSLFKSFRFAFEGIFSAIKSETNWKIGLLQGLAVILAGFYLHISRYDWVLVSILIGLVLMAELINSAVEEIVNSFTTRGHPSAKLAKDFSAGAVVVMIIAAGISGIIIFLPYLNR